MDQVIKTDEDNFDCAICVAEICLETELVKFIKRDNIIYPVHYSCVHFIEKIISFLKDMDKVKKAMDEIEEKKITDKFEASQILRKYL